MSFYHLYCYGNRFKKGWWKSKSFHSLEDAIAFMAFVKKGKPLYKDTFFYKLVDVDNHAEAYFKVILGDFANCVRNEAPWD